MRSKYILGVLGVGLVMAIAGGCGSEADDGPTGGTGAAGSGSSSSSGNGAATSSSSTSAAGGNGGEAPTKDGNDDFGEAEELPVNDAIEGAESVDSDLGFTGDADFYKFDGTAGQAIQFVVFAQEAVDPPKTFDPAYIDSIITLYNAQMEQIAFNDDPIPQSQNDSQLTTVLPADGQYFLKINECWSNYDTCAGTADKEFTDYTIFAFNLNPEDLGTVADVEGSETAIDYAVNAGPGTGYYATTVYGMFDTDTDVDVFPFTVPSDIQITTGRTTAYVEATLTGTEANGSTVPQGKIWIEDGAVAGTRLAEIDGTKMDPQQGFTLSLPVVLNNQYKLFVEHPDGLPSGTNPFYVLTQYNGGSNQPEAELLVGGTNNTRLTAEAMPTGMTAAGNTAYFVSGDLAGADAVDWFSFDVLGVAGDKMYATCSGQRIGSGLRGLKFTVFRSDDTPVAGATATETADANASLADPVDFPVGDTTLWLKVEKASQEPSVLGTYYQCGAGFITPMP